MGVNEIGGWHLFGGAVVDVFGDGLAADNVVFVGS